ncbi:MAG TPA: hypothetical protein VFA50_08535 [Stellaceae bacterium]|nr:hypothetical protein [Stellaceae bacterium]
MGRLAIAALLLLLASCGTAGGGWTRPGADDEAVARDLGECRAEARAATRRDAQIDADILASRGNDWQRTGTLALQRDNMAASRSAKGDAVLAACMAAKGYHRAG